MNEVLIILADGFEEAEAVITIDVLRRLNIDVCIASLNSNLQTISSRGIKIIAEKYIGECKNTDYKAVILPGGMPGAANLRESADVIEIIKQTFAKGNLVCAICAAPIALAKAGVLDGKKFTAYPGFDDLLPHSPETAMVVVDGNVITGKGPAAAFEFAKKIGETLGKNTSQVFAGMLF